MKTRLLKIAAVALFAVACFNANAENLLTLNSSFEKDGEGWGRIDGSYWRISENAWVTADGGAKALQRVAYKGSKPGAVWTFWNQQKVPVKAGDAYRLAVGVSGSGQAGRYSQGAVLRVFDAAGKEIAILEGDAIKSTNNYRPAASVLTMPAGAATVQVGVRININEPLDDVAYIFFDAVSLTAEAGAAKSEN